MEFIPFEKDDPKSNRRCCYLSELRSKKPVFTKHGPEYFPILVDIFLRFKPDMIIELGTFHGGATLVFHEAMLDVEIHTFDKQNLIDLGLFDRNKVFFYQEDLIDAENSTVVKVLETNKHKRKILYCDNGNKEKEIKLYAKYLSAGDLLGCHDWRAEVRPEVIAPVLLKHNFVSSPDNDLFRNKNLLSRFWIKEK